MHRNDSEKQRDIINGEAILELLDENEPITNALLLQKLQDLLSAEVEAWRESAIHSAINEVTAAASQCPHICNNTTDALTGLIFNKKTFVH